MKKQWLLGTAFLCLIQLKTQAQALNLSLNEVLERAQQSSRSIQIQKYKIEIAEEKIKDAQKNKWPELSIQAAADQASNFLIYENGLFKKPSKHDVIHNLYSTNTNLYLNLYEGLKVKNTIALKEIEAQLQNELLTENIAAIKLEASLLFLELFLQEKWEELMLSDIEDKEHQLKEIKDYHELGVVLQSDVLRSELELSKRKMTLIEIQHQKKKLNQKLNTIIGLPDEQKIKPEIDLENIPASDSFEKTLENGQHSAYLEKISHFHVNISEKKYDLVKSANSIKLGIGGSFQFSNPQIFLYPYNPHWYTLGTIGLKATYPISELYKNKHKKTAAKIEIEEAHEHHKKIQDEIRTQLYNDYLSLDESMKQINIYQLNTDYASENARILKDAYFNQTALITDLLDADILLLKSKFELKQAKINALKNFFKLQYSKGSL